MNFFDIKKILCFLTLIFCTTAYAKTLKCTLLFPKTCHVEIKNDAGKSGYLHVKCPKNDKKIDYDLPLAALAAKLSTKLKFQSEVRKDIKISCK